MKKIIAIILTALMCCAFTACSKDDGNGGGQQSSVAEKSAADKAKELLDAVTFPEMVSKDLEFAEYAMGITPDLISEYVLYVCGSGAMPDEFGIFVAASAEDANTIRSRLISRIDYQRETYSTYSPDEAYKLTDCFCEVNGNTVIYAVCADNQKAKDILK